MEPRIATLLGESSLERTTLDPIVLLPPPSLAPRRPLPVEPTPVGDDARPSAAPRRNDYIANDGFKRNRTQASSSQHSRQKSSVPIAEVLNSEGPTASAPAPYALPPPAPFSGRLSDILLDPSQQNSNKRRKVDGHTTPPAIGGEHTLLTLPKLPQLPKKAARRPRIPPLLQGLHQPPPLPPEGRLFPPITGEGGGFGRDIGERVGLRSPASLDRGKEKEIPGPPGANGAASNGRVDKELEKAQEQDKVVESPKHVGVEDRAVHTRAKEDGGKEKESGRAKESKKRNKWSEQETTDLLHGVSRFGIGNWKKILQCTDFNFNQRTAVDLKDRFRTVCPGEGLKQRKPKGKGNSEASDAQKQPELTVVSSHGNTSSQETSPTHTPAGKQTAPRKPRGDTHRKSQAELAEIGIQGPFVKNNRRERREFTEQDDENLLRGFEKYGTTWHSMRDDRELGFNTRHATDLRDRFRIRYPELYAKAGYKLKAKDEQILKEKGKDKPESSSQESVITANDGQYVELQNSGSSRPILDVYSAVATSSTPASSSLRARALFQPVLNAIPGPFEEFGDLLSDDGEGGNSPITLNRNIFQWADANPSQTNSNSSNVNLPAVGALPSDILFGAMDGIHINPLATLKLPMSSLTNNILSGTHSYPGSANALLLSQPANPTPNANISAAPANPTSVPNSSSSKHSTNHLLRTPNLPTIVFPHVPVSSARSTVHNLPPPADLLSGLDLDARVSEQPTAGFMLDDGLGFTGYGPGASLAPLMGGTSGAGGNGSSGRGILGFERVFD